MDGGWRGGGPREGEEGWPVRIHRSPGVPRLPHPQGEAARVQAEAVWGELEAELRTALNAEEQAQLVALLRKVRAALDQERA